MKPLQALLALFACAVLPLTAADLDDLTWTTTDGEVSITGCDVAATGELVIPDTIDGNPVTSIGQAAFYRCSSLTSIAIPDSVTSIGDFAFYLCSSLTSITIPDSVTSIEQGAFYQCSSLTSVTFMGTAPAVGPGAFSGVADGAVAIMPGEEHASFGDVGDYWNGLALDCIDGVLCWLTWTTTDGEVAISDCDQAASGELVIPDTIDGNPVTSIGQAAFYRCSSLTSVTIGDGVESIGTGAFSECSSLTGITIPDSVTSIGDFAFNECTRLTSITIGDGVESIGIGAFSECSSLTGITIPDGVTSIGNQAFYQCSSLTSVTIGSGVTSIGAFAFYQCSSLTSVTIGSGVTSIEYSAFYNCASLTSITIGDGVTSIGEETFEGCANLTSITFMGTAPAVGANAFTGVAHGAVALVTRVALSSFGNFGTWNGLTVGMSHSDLNDLLAQSSELSQRPTQAAYDAAVATARTDGQEDVTSDPASYSLFTEDQIHALSADYTMGLNEAGNVEIKIFFIESADLQTFTPFTVNPDSVSVVDGKICMEFPSEDRGFFFRFRVE